VLWSGVIDDFDDFADFSSTQLAPSEDKKGGGVAGDDDPFLSSLQSRLKQVQERSDKLVSVPRPLVLLTCTINTSSAHAQAKTSLECPHLYRTAILIRIRLRVHTPRSP
jgi:hypothetical protein